MDVANGKITASGAKPPSLDVKYQTYPQPRCATALRLGPVDLEVKKSGNRSKTLIQTARLDLKRAVATLLSSENVKTQIRVLHDRNVMLVNSPYPISIEPMQASANIATIPDPKSGKTDGIDWMLVQLPGDIDYKGMDYAVAVASQGNLKAVALVTSFDIQSSDVLPAAIALAKNTITQEESKLIAAHEKGWELFWSRSGVCLEDAEMQRWWYRLLYYAQTVCKPGAAPVGLMPPLATDHTPWHSDFHHDYNAWQTFYPLPGCNQPALVDSWITYLNKRLPRFKYFAEAIYSIDGIAVPITTYMHEPDPENCKSVNKRQVWLVPYSLAMGVTGMTVQSVWQKHLFEPDPAYLETKIYPMLKGAAKFYVGIMEQCKKGEDEKILLGPSYSPERGSAGVYNTTFDIAYFHYTLEAFIQAAGELKKDAELVEKCRYYKNLLPDYPTTMHEGKQIVIDWKGAEYFDKHNITVPSLPVFPGEQVTWFSPEPVKKLFLDTIAVTKHTDNNSHVMFNIAKARLSMPEAFTNSKKWFASREQPNGFFTWAGHAHGSYMGEMIGIAGLINEFLLQSVQNKIRLFPCWPKDKEAQFKRLRTQGGFLVSAEQKQGEVTQLEIVSTVGGKLQLLSPWKEIKANEKALKIDEQGLITVMTNPGETVVFTK